mmetsp:Transcript_16153/g.41173  ORF Transcript_16153/g.41173 Transcript_16153/m.41173 type:complete len:359 (+) Transcript_16153:659-1735(+)
MDHAVVVQVSHSREHLRHVEAHRALLHAAASIDHGGEVARRHVLESKEDVARRVEGEEALDQKVGGVAQQDLLLDAHVDLLLALLLLGVLPAALDPDRLQSENVARRLFLDEPDVCVRARVEDAEQVEVGDRVLEQRRRAVDRTGHVVGPAHIVELRDQLLYLLDARHEQTLEVGGGRVIDLARRVATATPPNLDHELVHHLGECAQALERGAVLGLLLEEPLCDAVEALEGGAEHPVARDGQLDEGLHGALARGMQLRLHGVHLAQSLVRLLPLLEPRGAAVGVERQVLRRHSALAKPAERPVHSLPALRALRLRLRLDVGVAAAQLVRLEPISPHHAAARRPWQHAIRSTACCPQQ